MDKNIKSFYIRVLRGKYDKGRGNPKYMRNVAKEMEWFYHYDIIKKSFNRDADCPEEIYTGWPSSRMPGCYKWARKYVVDGSEEITKELQQEREKEEFLENSKEPTLMRKLKAWVEYKFRVDYKV